MEERKTRKEKDMQHNTKTVKGGQDAQTYWNNWNLGRGHFQKCPNALQWNRQHKKKICAQQNASFVNQIRDSKTPSKLDFSEMTIIQGLLDVANPKM